MGYWDLGGKLLVSFKVIFIGVTNFVFPWISWFQTCRAISFSVSEGIFWVGLSMFCIIHVCMLSCFSHVQLFMTLWTVTYQAPLAMVILQCIAMPSSRGSFQPRDRTHISYVFFIDCFFYHQCHLGGPYIKCSSAKSSPWLWSSERVRISTKAERKIPSQ